MEAGILFVPFGLNSLNNNQLFVNYNNNCNNHLLSAYSIVHIATLASAYVSTYLIFTPTLGSTYCYFSHFADEETSLKILNKLTKVTQLEWGAAYDIFRNSVNQLLNISSFKLVWQGYYYPRN